MQRSGCGLLRRAKSKGGGREVMPAVRLREVEVSMGRIEVRPMSIQAGGDKITVKVVENED